ncbi:MAG: outer membrane beta-barrel protein [Bacteroidales bacterium]|nr:outer membrane beta-barrel protein [Bacteroidales bacterium]
MNPVQRLISTCVIALFIAPVYSQVRPFINLNIGYDYNINKYYSGYGYEKFEGTTDFNAGLNAGITLGKRVRFRVGFNYVQFTYGEKPIPTSTEIGLYTEASMRISSLNVLPSLDCRLVSANKFDFYLSAGYHIEWVADHYQSTKLTDDGWTSKFKFIDPDYTKTYTGPTGAIIVKYNLGKHLGITLEPRYTYFLKELYYRNDGVLQRISCNLGVEYKF